MTKPYGVTKFGLIAQVRESLKKSPKYIEGLRRHASQIQDVTQCREQVARLHRDVGRFVADRIYETVQATLGRTEELMVWLRDCAERLVENGHPIQWTTPVGFPVMQAYPHNKARKIRTELSSIKRFKMSTLTIKFPTDELATRKAINGIVANFVHSYDAAHMMLTALAAKRDGITSLRMIHDSFATHPGEAGLLARALRQEFVTMYENNDVLRAFYESCARQLEGVPGVQLREPPQLGLFNLGGVRDSVYFFS